MLECCAAFTADRSDWIMQEYPEKVNYHDYMRKVVDEGGVKKNFYEHVFSNIEEWVGVSLIGPGWNWHLGKKRRLDVSLSCFLSQYVYDVMVMGMDDGIVTELCETPHPHVRYVAITDEGENDMKLSSPKWRWNRNRNDVSDIFFDTKLLFLTEELMEQNTWLLHIAEKAVESGVKVIYMQKKDIRGNETMAALRRMGVAILSIPDSMRDSETIVADVVGHITEEMIYSEPGLMPLTVDDFWGVVTSGEVFCCGMIYEVDGDDTETILERVVHAVKLPQDKCNEAVAFLQVSGDIDQNLTNRIALGVQSMIPDGDLIIGYRYEEKEKKRIFLCISANGIGKVMQDEL